MEKLNLSLAALLLLSCVGTTFSMDAPLTEKEKLALGKLQEYRAKEAVLSNEIKTLSEIHDFKTKQLEFKQRGEVVNIIGEISRARKRCEEETGIKLGNINIQHTHLLLIVKGRVVSSKL